MDTTLQMDRPTGAAKLTLELVRNLGLELERTRDALGWLLSQTECGCEDVAGKQFHVHSEPCPLAIASDIASGLRTSEGSYLPSEQPMHFTFEADDTTSQRTYRIISSADARAWHRATGGDPKSLCPHLCRVTDIDDARVLCHFLNEGRSW